MQEVNCPFSIKKPSILQKSVLSSFKADQSLDSKTLGVYSEWEPSHSESTVFFFVFCF